MHAALLSGGTRRDTHCLGDLFHDMVVIDARDTSASAEWLATVIESTVAQLRSVTRGWRMQVIVTLFALAVGGTAASAVSRDQPWCSDRKRGGNVSVVPSS